MGRPCPPHGMSAPPAWRDEPTRACTLRSRGRAFTRPEALREPPTGPGPRHVPRRTAASGRRTARTGACPPGRGARLRWRSPVAHAEGPASAGRPSGVRRRSPHAGLPLAANGERSLAVRVPLSTELRPQDVAFAARLESVAAPARCGALECAHVGEQGRPREERGQRFQLVLDSARATRIQRAARSEALLDDLDGTRPGRPLVPRTPLDVGGGLLGAALGGRTGAQGPTRCSTVLPGCAASRCRLSNPR